MKTIIAAIVLSTVISGCSASYEELIDNNYSSQDKFHQTIIEEYKARAIFEADEMHDWNSAKLYSEKAIKSYKGEKIKPEPLSNWKIEVDKIGDIENAYNNLMMIYEDSIIYDPVNLGIAVASLDCWAEQEEEGWQINHIEICKSRFLNAMKNLNKYLLTKDNTEKITDSTIVITKENQRIDKIIYFDFDKYKLTLDNINEIKDYINSNDINRYLIIGYTDTKGTNEYNYELSLKRAESVKDFLLSIGVEKDNIKIIGMGEKELAKFTNDEVKHPANRRVVIKSAY
ncbi:MAG: Outer membrane protein P6 [Alphaproteobacteria bacterium MarineAlpha5_Bin11]|nr:MAG: Outer membrane protein P6 [Alphaproteobacteria bacterium MarineAlpha5_Bin11]PPR51166.1 MAG: Outer membrane protein P6 [Alphaproteobacteria bacterium MarineAlpha5_Bin10]|tara:strand:+ start:12182 stop:13039 length:858 start_codon:yes stop_codon:yes gene_type:complete